MIFAQFFTPRGKLVTKPLENPRARVKLVPMALPIGKTQSLHGGEFAQRPGETGGGILPAREQDQGLLAVRAHRSDVAQRCAQGESSGRSTRRDRAFRGKLDRHGGSFAGRAQNRKPPLMQLYKRIGEWQTEAHAFEAPREPAVELLEGLQRVSDAVRLHA